MRRADAPALVLMAIGLDVLVAATWLLGHPRYATPAAFGAVPVASRSGVVAPAVPRRLRIPSLHIDAPVRPESVQSGALGVPDDPSTLGWYRAGARPGSARGTVLIDGHVDTAGGREGALFHLSRLAPDAEVDVVTNRGTVRYRAVARRTYAKSALPADLFAGATAARLALVTCGGAFDFRTRHYADNVVVYAIPLS